MDRRQEKTRDAIFKALQTLLKQKSYNSITVPETFLIHHLAGSFTETVKWWVSQNMDQTPEMVAAYYMAVSMR